MLVDYFIVGPRMGDLVLMSDEVVYDYVYDYKTVPSIRILILENGADGESVNIKKLKNSIKINSDIIRLDEKRLAFDLLCNSQFDIFIIETGPYLSEEKFSSLVRLAKDALVIAISENSSISSRINYLSLGAHDFLSKPIDYSNFYEKMKKISLSHSKGRIFQIEQEKKQEEEKEKENIVNMIGINKNNSAEENNIYVGKHNKNSSSVKLKPEIKPMWQQERKIIEDAILMFNGNISLAAKALQISPSTIYRKRQTWNNC